MTPKRGASLPRRARQRGRCRGELEKLGVTFAVTWSQSTLNQHGTRLTPQTHTAAQIRVIRDAADQIEPANDHTENR